MATAEEMIRRLGLSPHPEGGHYREVHRSGRSLGTPPGYPSERVALTAIYFLLARGEFSAFHRVDSEEVWVHLAGAALDLVTLEPEVGERVLAPAGEGEPLAVMPPGALQAGRSRGAWTLVTCLVAPGFEFGDFRMPTRGDLLARFPAHADLIRRFTRA